MNIGQCGALLFPLKFCSGDVARGRQLCVFRRRMATAMERIIVKSADIADINEEGRLTATQRYRLCRHLRVESLARIHPEVRGATNRRERAFRRPTKTNIAKERRESASAAHSEMDYSRKD